MEIIIHNTFDSLETATSRTFGSFKTENMTVLFFRTELNNATCSEKHNAMAERTM